MCLTAKPNEEWTRSAWKRPASGAVAVVIRDPPVKKWTPVRFTIADCGPVTTRRYSAGTRSAEEASDGHDRPDQRAVRRRRRQAAAVHRRRVARRQRRRDAAGRG